MNEDTCNRAQSSGYCSLCKLFKKGLNFLITFKSQVRFFITEMSKIDLLKIFDQMQCKEYFHREFIKMMLIKIFFF